MPETPSGRLVLVRHGATEWSLCGRHTGRTDLPLAPEGRDQARALAPRLADQAFDLVLVSPRRRALETAELAGLGDRAEVTGDLAEWDYGGYEGRTTGEIRDEVPGWSLFTHGVPEGERAADVGRRADEVIVRARAVPGDTLCVAHGHILRVLAARWLGLPPAGGRLFQLDAGSLSELGWERQVPVVSRWNEPARA
jgi:broad specificity phosphatase PhoE